jgi:hypothetical protein
MTLARAEGARPDSARSAFTSPPRDRVAAPGREDGRWNVPTQRPRVDAAAAAAEESSTSDAAFMRAQRVTVLMATYNRGRYIEEALDSLLGQTRPPDEILVVDDGSTDDTRERVRGYGERVRYLAKKNGGKASALNVGLREATGDWIWCFDDDDVAVPEGLEQMLRHLARHRTADFVYGGQFTGKSGPDGRIVRGHPVLPPDLPAGELFGRTLRTIPFLMQSALIRRDPVHALGGFDERYARSQDYEFVTRLVAACRGVRVGQPIVVWRSHDGPRGPRHDRHDGTLRERVWMDVAATLGKDLRRRLPLAAYLPGESVTAILAMTDLRRALLQRMTVMASKGLVRELAEDLHSAARLAGPGPALGRDEAIACREVGNFQFFRMRLLDAPDRLVASLSEAADCATGKAIVACLARGILHAARHRERSRRERRVMLLSALRLFVACGASHSFRAYVPVSELAA